MASLLLGCGFAVASQWLCVGFAVALRELCRVFVIAGFEGARWQPQSSFLLASLQQGFAAPSPGGFMLM